MDSNEDLTWRSASFRQSVVNKINEAISHSDLTPKKNTVEMENHVFSKAKNKDEYLSFVARLIIHVREMNNKNKNPEGGNPSQGPAGSQQQGGIQDPINALANLTQGTRNPQMMPQQPTPNMPMMRPQQQQQNMMQQQMTQMQMNPQQAQQMKPIVPNQMAQQNQMMQGNMMQGGQPPMMNQMANPMMSQGGMMPRSNMPPNQMVNPMGQNVMQNMQAQGMPGMRKQEMMMNQGAGGNFPVRSVTPNFLRQSPSPMSPLGLGQQHSIASPAMGVPSPQAPLSNQPRGGVNMSNIMAAPSPSAPMNTPGQPSGIGSVQSPMNPVDDQIYREKYNRLTKYKEPLKKMISRVGSDANSEKITKLRKLLEILSNPDTRIPLETLDKCEIVLENQFGALEPPSINNPLYDAIANSLQNPLGSHILHRSFKSFDLIFGPDIKNLPPAKKRRLSEDQVVPSLPNEIPHTLQREIARLNSKFKISLDMTCYTMNAKNLTLTCCLDDKQLPPVPPLTIAIAEEYPMVSPQCTIVDHEYDDSEFLGRVKRALKARISKLPKLHSLTHILETWCLAIRQACNVNYVEPSIESVLMCI